MCMGAGVATDWGVGRNAYARLRSSLRSTTGTMRPYPCHHAAACAGGASACRSTSGTFREDPRRPRLLLDCSYFNNPSLPELLWQ
jgi:hypothetical protein